jgi:hypothetical protein
MPEHAHLSFPRGTLRRWDREVNDEPVPDDQPNRVTFVAVGVGRPASRDEIFAFVAENNARYAREHSEE